MSFGTCVSALALLLLATSSCRHPAAEEYEESATSAAAKETRKLEGNLLLYHGRRLVQNEGGWREQAQGPGKARSFELANQVPYKEAREYIDRCRDEGVPIPPPWGDPLWVLKGPLKTHIFVSSLSAALSVYHSEKPLGVCTALSRDREGGGKQLGVICHSLESGKTCFWDNNLGTHFVPLGGGDGEKPYEVIMGAGANILEENCTDCHRGDTPWIRVRGEPTETLRGKEYIKKPWSPFALGRAGWQNAPGPKVEGCSNCHAMPVASRAYCMITSNMVSAELMPPPNIKGEAAAKMTKAFKEYCGGFSW
jgi:hypothetical protein